MKTAEYCEQLANNANRPYIDSPVIYEYIIKQCKKRARKGNYRYTYTGWAGWFRYRPILTAGNNSQLKILRQLLYEDGFRSIYDHETRHLEIIWSNIKGNTDA